MRSTSLATARRQGDAWSSYRAHSRRQPMSRAFDAAGSQGLAYLNGQLEMIEPNLVKPLQATTHARDITVKTGGGFPEVLSAYASNLASTATQFFGLQGTNNTDIPEAQVDVQKGTWPTYLWAQGMTVTWLDLERLEFAERTGQGAPFSLQDLYDASIEVTFAKACDYVVYKGWLGGFGLCNNPDVDATYVVDAGTGTAWANKTPVQWLNDINAAVNRTVINSGYAMNEGCGDSLLLPFAQFALLSNPMVIGGVGYQSAIEYIKKNCVAAAYGVDLNIFPLPNVWIAGQGLGGSDRGILYRNAEESLMFRVPTRKQKGMTVPTTKDGGAYQTLYRGCIGHVLFKRNTTMTYLDGI